MQLKRMDKSPMIYRLKPIFELPKDIDLPTCMYPMKNIVSFKDFKSDQNNKVLDNIMDKKPLPELSVLEIRWDSVLQQLSELKNQVNSVSNEIKNIIASNESNKYMLDENELNNLKVLEAVINVNPSNPPYSLFLIEHLCQGSIVIKSHVHSNVNTLPDKLKNFCQSSRSTKNSILFTLIWKEGFLGSELVVNPIKALSIRGEVNILRHLGRLGLKFLRYPPQDIYDRVQMDCILDMCDCLLYCRTPREKSAIIRNLNSKLGRNPYFGKDDFNITDFSVWSILKQININPNQDLTPNMSKWFKNMDNILPY